MNKYKIKCNTSKGAIFFIVSNGKYTEGYNFSGNFCRTIIVVGVPNRNLGEYKIKIKQKKYGTK